jgi:hypothetical protein
VVGDIVDYDPRLGAQRGGRGCFATRFFKIDQQSENLP